MRRGALSVPGLADLAGALPWIAFALVVPLLLRFRPRLDRHPPPPPEASPLVSIIVPARNEAENISTCVATLMNTSYPQREIIVVDDGSLDGTTDIARILADRSAGAIRLVEGEPLPEGWMGKCWACWQGYGIARGELLCFTDADTRHEDDLLGHAVGALTATDADLVSVLPHQVMESFWERVVLPHIFTILSLRYRDLARVNRARNPRDVIANGQFILIRRAAYERIGGHRALRQEVVEDLRLAQRVREEGGGVYLAHAANLMETRMYRSLRGIVEGWSKNLARGARRTVDPWLEPAIPWILGAGIIAFWTVPAALFLASFVVPGLVVVRAWALVVALVSLLFWGYMNVRMRVPPLHAFFFPLGGLIAGSLFLRSAVLGEQIRWKGRTYRVDPGAPGRPGAGLK